MTRLFVGVWPPPEVVEALHRLPRPETRGVRWSTPDQWHVTLRFLGDVDDVQAVVDALSTVGQPVARVDVGPATKRLGDGVLMLPVVGLDDLAKALPLPLDRPFRGHLTVARARSRGQVPRSLEGEPFEASWTATSFALVRSRTKPTGAVYDDVATFPLLAEQHDAFGTVESVVAEIDAVLPIIAAGGGDTASWPDDIRAAFVDGLRRLRRMIAGDPPAPTREWSYNMVRGLNDAGIHTGDMADRLARLENAIASLVRSH